MDMIFRSIIEPNFVHCGLRNTISLSAMLSHMPTPEAGLGCLLLLIIPGATWEAALAWSFLVAGNNIVEK